MQSFKINNGKVYIFLITLLVIILTLLIPTIRTVIQGNPLTSSETFYHLNNIISPTNFFDQVISFLINKFGELNTIIYLPIILIVLSLWLFSSIIKEYLETDSEYYYTLLLLVLSPTFLAAHIGLTTMSIISFLTLTTFWLYKKKAHIYLLFLAFLFLVDPIIGLFLSGFFIFSETKNKNWKGIIIILFSTIVFLTTSITQSINSSIINFDLITFNINDMFSFFGAQFGFTITIVLLTILGLLISSEEEFSQNIFLTTIILISLIYEPARIIGLLVMIFYSTKSINFLVNYKWKIDFLKTWTIIIIICLILFSTILFVQNEIFKSPTKNQITALKALKNYDKSHFNKILAWPQEAEMIKYFSNKNVFGSKYRFDSNSQIVEEIFSSRNYQFIKKELQKENIAYIFIDNKINSFLKKPQEGILFVMNHNNNFVKVFELNDVSIYYFKLWNE